MSAVKKTLVGGGKKGSSVGSSIGGGTEYDNEDSGPGSLRLRYSVPIWFNTLFVFLIFWLVVGGLGMIIYHHRHDADAYVCNEDDRDRWFCPAIFEPDTDDCEPLPYKSWATGGSFQTCFYDICVYFKDWSPVLPYPCFDEETFPQAGKEHCLDFISHDYEKRDRLEVILFCIEGQPVCIYRDKCSHYGVVDSDETEETSVTSKSTGDSNGSVLGVSQLSIMNGTNFYVYGSLEALKKTSK